LAILVTIPLLIRPNGFLVLLRNIFLAHSTIEKNNEGRLLPELFNPFGETTPKMIQWGENQRHSLVLF
jgi:hypothetical protein